MPLEMNVKDFADINLYSNENLSKVLTDIVSESSNAILVSTFTDKVILFDTVNEEFYQAKYTADTDKVKFFGFDKIKLIKEDKDFNQTLSKYFKEEFEVEEVMEEYANVNPTSVKLLQEEVNKKITSKKPLADFYNSILEAKAKLDLSKLKATKFYEDYTKREELKPTQTVLFFDWFSPVNVSLLDESEDTFSITSKEKATKLWNDSKFQTLIKEKKIVEAVKLNPSIALLDITEMKELFSKTMLLGGTKNVSSEVKKIFENEEFINIMEDLTSTATPEAQPEVKEPSEEQAPSVSDSDIDTIVSSLEGLKANVSVDKAKEFIDGVISKVKEMKNGTYDPEFLKEVKKLLTPVENSTPKEETKEPTL